jgi:nitrate reductase beta subunit
VKENAMDVRAQIASVFHLDKCLGCHTCSVACKNLWTDRKGAEHMWWNNVEARPGAGYPRGWEDQERWSGGWTVGGDGGLELRAGSKTGTLSRLFHNPALPVLDDYYEPWTYRYGDLFDSKPSDTAPSARPISAITGQPMEPRAGPNWDDDLAGSRQYAAKDPNLAGLTDAERAALQATERLAYFHLPRTCNHCANPACVAACPSGAAYKRGEDGLVVISQDGCRGWRMCVSSCPYKKVFYNWETGKSEKCIGCYPRIECGEAPACFAACPGRIRFQGVLLYDAERISTLAARPEQELVAAARELVLDPEDPIVLEGARRSGIPEATIEAARRSPVFRFLKRWQLALPLHPEFRTLPMVFYVPPLAPLLAERTDDVTRTAEGLFATVESSRLPLRYLSALFAGGNDDEVARALRKLLALRLWRRRETVGDVDAAEVSRAFAEADLTPADAGELHRLTTWAPLEERVVLPPSTRAEDLDPWPSPTELRFQPPGRV